MARKVKYITQLTEKEINDMLAAADPEPGFLIHIDKHNDRLRISIDENALRLAINGFVRNGGTMTSASDCMGVSFDPPS